MGGSPCKAWDWRNPIVQTLFTQGPTRTASVAHGEIRATSERAARRRQPASGLLSRPGCYAVLRARRCYAHGEIRAQTGGVVLRPQPAAARLCRPGPGGVGPGFSGFGRRYAKGRLPIPWGGKGAADHAKAGQKRQRPAGGGGGRAEPARRGPLAPAMFGPSGRTPPPPAGDAGLQGFELSALLGILYPVA